MSLPEALRRAAIKEVFATAAAYLEQNKERFAGDKSIDTILDVFNSGLKLNVTTAKTKIIDLLTDFCHKEAEK